MVSTENGDDRCDDGAEPSKSRDRCQVKYADSTDSPPPPSTNNRPPIPTNPRPMSDSIRSSPIPCSTTSAPRMLSSLSTNNLLETSPVICSSSHFPGYDSSIGPISGGVAASVGGKMTPEDFQLLRVVGQGAFGRVFQVRCVRSGDIFAMKVMRKDKILAKNQAEYMRQERDILTCVQHPFIVKLHYSFQTESKLYLIMDFVNGGHLFFQLYRQGMFSEDLARIYCAQIVLAVSHLHSLNIAHRDLKPENILLDHQGHLVLTDFGLAKKVKGDAHTNSMCGTMEYMAPEIITAKGHGRPADWWSVGVLVFEMLTGKHPFSARNRQTLQKKILNEKLKLPPYLSQEACSLLKGLLTRDVKTRLGCDDAGFDKIKKHKFFAGINWKKLEARQVPPPFQPEVEGAMCVANFDEDFTSLPATDDSPCGTPEPHHLDKANKHFSGFTFISPSLKDKMLNENGIEQSPVSLDNSAVITADQLSSEVAKVSISPVVPIAC